MKLLSMKSLGAACALAVASMGAQAVPVVPPATFNNTTVGVATDSPGLFVAVWDAVRGVSLVTYLGINMADFLPAVGEASPSGNREFGVLNQFTSVFTGSSNANINYAVFAVDTLGVGTASKRVWSGTQATSFNINNTSVSGTATNIESFITGALTNAIANGGCGGVNPCTAASASESDYAPNIQWSTLMNTAFFAPVNTALNFFMATSSTVGGPNGAASVNFYNDASGTAFGRFLLGANGAFAYIAPVVNVVPLPAAVWLLLSALGGLGLISRRSAKAA